MALLSSLSLSLLRDTPKGKAETKAALKSDSLSTPSRSAGRPAAAAGAASAVSSASGALAALFCADEKGAAESSSTVTVPKTVAKDASLRAPVPVKPLQPKPKGYPKPKPAGRPEAEPKAKAMSSLLGAYSDSEDEEEEQMKPGRLSTAAQAVLATAGANKLRAEAQAPPVLKAPPLVAPAVVAPATAPATAPAAVAPAAAAPRTARAVTVASRMAAAQHHGLAVMKPLVGVGGEERSVERIDMSRIDGEELSPEELPQVAHKCGANAWRWRVREWRPNPRGLPLGNFNALEERSEVSGSRAEEPEVEEDPDMEDFAFFAGLTETTGEPEACELEVPPTASSSSRASAPLAFANAAKEKRQEEEELRQEEERKRQEEEERREEKRRKIEEERRRKEEEEAREREKKRREEAIRQAEEERERRAQRRKMEEEEKKRTEASRIETVKKRAEEIERRRQAEEEFLANAEAQKKAQAKMEVKVPSSLPVAEGSLSALLRTGAPDLRRPAEPAEPPRAPVLERHSRSPRRKPEPKAMPRPPEPKAMPRKPEPKPMPKPEAVPKEMPLNIGSAKEPVGWMPENYTCDSCQKQVSASGGIFCGRRRGQQLRGCGAAVCWRCMNRSSKDLDFGKVRTTKAEFDSLGGEAWWMHEACMDDEDLQDYYDGEEAQFAWE